MSLLVSDKGSFHILPSLTARQLVVSDSAWLIQGLGPEREIIAVYLILRWGRSRKDC